MGKHWRIYKAAQSIQRAWRAHFLYTWYTTYRSATIIQKTWRSYWERTEFEYLRECTMAVQTAYRAYAARQVVAKLFDDRERRFMAAVTKMQANFRGRKNKREFASTMKHLAKAQKLIKKGDLIGAELKLREGLKGSNNPHFIYMQMGALQEMRGDHAAAAKAYREAVKIAPSPVSRLRLGIALQNINDFDGAIQVMKVAKDEHADKVDDWKTKSANDPALHLNLGVVYRKNGQRKEAVQEFEEAVRLDPEDANAFYYLGFTQLELNNRVEALDAFTWAVEIDPSNIQVQMQLGALKAKIDPPDYAGSISAYRMALHYEPNNMKVQYALGDTLSKAGKREEAIKELLVITDQEPPKSKKTVQIYKSALQKLAQLYSSALDDELREESDRLRDRLEKLHEKEEVSKRSKKEKTPKNERDRRQHNLAPCQIHEQ